MYTHALIYDCLLLWPSAACRLLPCVIDIPLCCFCIVYTLVVIIVAANNWESFVAGNLRSLTWDFNFVQQQKKIIPVIVLNK